MRNGTIAWGGLPNLTWFANRTAGVSGFFGTQLFPSVDEAAAKPSKEFADEVWRLAIAKTAKTNL